MRSKIGASVDRLVMLESGAGGVVPWLDEAAMTAALIHLDADHEQVARMVENAVTFARLNTREIWLDRRLKWTLNSSK
jgi:hypothetical protein